MLHRTYPLIACRRTTLQRYLEVTVGDNTHKHDNYRVKSRTLGYRLVTPTQDVLFGYNVPCTSLALFLLAVMAVVLSSCLSVFAIDCSQSLWWRDSIRLQWAVEPRTNLINPILVWWRDSIRLQWATEPRTNQPNTYVMTGQHSFTMSHGIKNKSTQY